jgi:hypothetical protein
MRRSVKWLLIGSGIFGAAGVAGLVWYLQPERHRFYTDADTIKQPLESATPRDILWQPPVKLGDVLNTAEQDYEPRLSWDGLTLYFVRGKAGENADIYCAKRTPTGWTEPRPLVDVNSGYDELGPEPSPDGQSLYFYSDRPGGQGGYDLWVAHRGVSGWQPPINLGPAVNSEFNDYGPALTPDGATLYFASNRPRPGDTDEPQPDAWPATVREDLFHRTYDLYWAPLTAAGAGAAEALDTLNTPHNEGAPCVSPAGDFVYFASDRPGGEGGFDLYRARRLRGKHEMPTDLGPSVNTAANELDPGLTHLGYALYFSSDRPLERVQADRPNDYNLYYTSAREVFADVELRSRPPIDWAALLAALWPNVLWLALGLLALLLLLVLMSDIRDRKRSLLARCLLASLLVHLVLFVALGFWKVGGSLSDLLRRGGRVQVVLSTPGKADELTAQIRGQLTDVEIPMPLPPDVSRASSVIEIQAPDAMAALAIERAAVDLDEQPALRSVVRDAPAPALDPALRSEPLSSAERMQLREIALPTESQRIAATEIEAAQVAPAEASARARSDVTLAVNRAAAPANEVALRPQTNDAEDEPRDQVSLTGGAEPRDATPWQAAAPVSVTEVAPDQPPSFDLALPTETDRQSGVEAQLSRVEPAVSESPRRGPVPAVAPMNSSSASVALQPVTTSANPGDFALASSVEVVVREVQPALVALPGLETSPANRASTRLPDLILPPLEQAAAAPASEDAPRVATVNPETARPAIAERAWSMTAAASPSPIQVNPEPTDALRNESAMVAKLQPRFAAAPTFASPALPALRSDAVALPDAPSLTLRLPSEMEPPVNPLAQRDEDRRRSFLERMGGSDETEQAVASALAWLARHQSPDGRWDSDGFDSKCGRCGGESDYEIDVALTGLSSLCFLGAGHTHTKGGPYQENVRNALTWLLSHQQSDGDLRAGETMYSQAIATIALAEACAMTADPTLAEPVERAAAFITAARNRRDGGWRYEPGQAGDTSVLGWQVMALKSARTAGIEVSEEAFDSARRWLELVESAARSGLYSYRPRQRPTTAMTAEALFVQQLLGMPRDDPRMRTSATFISQRLPSWDDQLNTYNWYYTTLALFHHQGESWTRWNEVLTEQLLEHQHTRGRRAGSWDPEGEWAAVGGRVYQTALCTLMLEVYYRYLPMYSGDLAVASGDTRPVETVGTIRGRVTDALTDAPLVGAEVRLDLPDAGPLVSTSDSGGFYKLDVPRVPNFVALSASREGYVPAAANVAAARLRSHELTQDFRLEPLADDVIAVEAVPQVHHLGNDRWEGRINSQFQKTAEGRVFTAYFELSASQLLPNMESAEVLLLVKGVQCPHRMYINGHLLDRRLSESPGDGSFGEFSAPFDPALLIEGVNTFEIRGVSCLGDLDDFEFVNVRLRLSR